MNPFKLLKAKCPALWAEGKKYGWKLAYGKLRLQLPMVRRTLARQAAAMRKKENINVCFILWNPSYWKTDSLFQLMLKHPRFNPVIAIEPNLGYAILADREREMESAKAYFREKGYPVLDEWEENDIRRVFHPDIIFSPNPYESTTEALLKGAFKELWCMCRTVSETRNRATPSTRCARISIGTTFRKMITIWVLPNGS